MISTRNCLELNSGLVVPKLRPLFASPGVTAVRPQPLLACRHASYVVQRTGPISLLLPKKQQNIWLQNCVRWTSRSRKTTGSVSKLLIFLVRQRKCFLTKRTEKYSKEFRLSFYSLTTQYFAEGGNWTRLEQELEKALDDKCIMGNFI